MLYLIVDTSILIDLERLDLIRQAGCLKQKLHIVDIVLRVECNHIEQLVKKCGFVIESLSGDELTEAYRVEGMTGKITIYDAMSFAFAKKRNMTLATGDGSLRALAERTGVKYIGLLWFIKEMYLQNIITLEDAAKILKAIKSDKRFRLPEKLVDQLAIDIGISV
jgi:predicted nucleic acid-binding protein